MKKFLRIFMWCLIAAIFIGAFVYLFVKSQPDKEKFELVSPSTGTIERNTVLTGKIEPRDEIEIKPQVSGIISEINVEEGDMVQAGDIVAKIKIVPDEGQLSSALSRVKTAKINLEDARVKHDRNKLLYDKKVISREEFENTSTTLSQAKAELEAAEDAYSIVKEGTRHHHRTCTRCPCKSRKFGHSGEHDERRYDRCDRCRHEQSHIRRQSRRDRSRTSVCRSADGNINRSAA